MHNLQFAKTDNLFYKQLSSAVRNSISSTDKKYGRIYLWFKFIFFVTAFLSAYFALFLFNTNSYNFGLLILNYIFIGWLGILLAFNSSHDAAHNTFSRNLNINFWIYTITFNLQGVNAYLWRIRHKSSHHVFANVDGCDADIDDNILLRLSPSHVFKKWHKYQYVYAFALYCMYTLHWIFIKDLVYLRKKNLANLKNQKHSIKQIVFLFAWKVFYFLYLIVIPIAVIGLAWQHVFIAFFIMHVCISVFFVHSLIISHLCLETAFPQANAAGKLPFNYHQHQLEVSLDYNAKSLMASWLFGGFNTHTAHHLFPNLPHTLYRKITPIIKQIAAQHNYPYYELNYFKAIALHYKYLKKLGNN